MVKDEALKYIKSGVGAPIIKIIEMEDEDIDTLHLKKALTDYYRRYPVKIGRQFTQGMTVPFKDLPGGEDHCLGIINYNFTPAAEFADPSIDDPFGLTRRLIDLSYTRVTEDQIVQRTTISSLRRPAFRVRWDEETKQIKFSSLYDGFYWVHFGVLKEIQDVPIRKIYDVLDLAVAYLKIYIAEVRSLLKFPGPLQFDADKMLAQGEKKRDEILKKWVVIPEVLIWR